MVNTKQLTLSILFTLCTACSSTESVYQQIGGQQQLEVVADNFIRQIEFDREIFPYFAESDVGRFREKFIEHLCVHTGGPCQYTGDEMIPVHEGMNITEAHFNQVVQLLINAMDEANVPHRLQNKVLAALAPMRSEIIYL